VYPDLPERMPTTFTRYSSPRVLPFLHIDHERPHDDAHFRVSPREGQRPRRIVLRLLAEGLVVVAMLHQGGGACR
jgi:hypothetical protein